MAIRNYPKMAACSQLGFDVTENSVLRSADPENPTLEPNMKCIWDYPLQRYGRLKFFHDGGGRHLEFVRTGNSAIRSAVAERTKHEVDRTTGCGDIAT